MQAFIIQASPFLVCCHDLFLLCDLDEVFSVLSVFQISLY